MGYQVRRAEAGDAGEISHVIVRALRETNACDYTPEIIARVEQSFSPPAVRLLIAQRDMFVALIEQRVVGTASLDGAEVRTMFVSPDVQRSGVGRRLMQMVEATARQRQTPVLRLNSSITAVPFYARLGYRIVREAAYGDERTIVMERTLAVS